MRQRGADASALTLSPLHSFWHAPAKRKRGPEGGNGGGGGDVVVRADASVRCLAGVTTASNALPGGRGGPQGRAGRRGTDFLIRVPVGTVVWQRLGARQRVALRVRACVQQRALTRVCAAQTRTCATRTAAA